MPSCYLPFKFCGVRLLLLLSARCHLSLAAAAAGSAEDVTAAAVLLAVSPPTSSLRLPVRHLLLERGCVFLLLAPPSVRVGGAVAAIRATPAPAATLHAAKTSLAALLVAPFAIELLLLERLRVIQLLPTLRVHADGVTMLSGAVSAVVAVITLRHTWR